MDRLTIFLLGALPSTASVRVTRAQASHFIFHCWDVDSLPTVRKPSKCIQALASIAVAVFMTAFVTPTRTADASQPGGAASLTNNRRHFTLGAWCTSSSRSNTPFTVTGVSDRAKHDVYPFVTGQMALPIGVRPYAGNGLRSWGPSYDTSITYRAEINDVLALLPYGQHVAIAPGDPVDTEYPYMSLGDFLSEEIVSNTYEGNYVSLGRRLSKTIKILSLCDE